MMQNNQLAGSINQIYFIIEIQLLYFYKMNHNCYHSNYSQYYPLNNSIKHLQNIPTTGLSQVFTKQNITFQSKSSKQIQKLIRHSVSTKQNVDSRISQQKNHISEKSMQKIPFQNNINILNNAKSSQKYRVQQLNGIHDKQRQGQNVKNCSLQFSHKNKSKLKNNLLQKQRQSQKNILRVSNFCLLKFGSLKQKCIVSEKLQQNLNQNIIQDFNNDENPIQIYQNKFNQLLDQIKSVESNFKKISQGRFLDSQNCEILQKNCEFFQKITIKQYQKPQNTLNNNIIKYFIENQIKVNSEKSRCCTKQQKCNLIKRELSFKSQITQKLIQKTKILELKLSDFQKGKLLGKGKYGEVFLVKHKQTGFLCALKIIQKIMIKEEKLQNQIIRELKIQSFLKHPNIINSYGFFDDEINLYVLLELCSGGHLYKKIRQNRRIPQQKTAQIIKQVCQGFKYLHSNRIIHRDLKPENIIIQSNIVKICDFGWAVSTGEGLRSTICGTPLYLSPQIIKKEQYDERIDIWAIGILTYQMLIGSIPFKIWSELQLNKIINDQVRFPDHVEISAKAKNFILKILQKESKNRSSIEDLLNHEFLKNVDNQNGY